jgi:hypothetical protein
LNRFCASVAMRSDGASDSAPRLNPRWPLALIRFSRAPAPPQSTLL